MLKMLRILVALGRDGRANVAVTTALCALPLFGMMGLAIDYAVALSAKSRLDAAADAAAVAAITTAQTTIQGGGSTNSGITQGQAQGAKAFAVNAGALSFTNVPTPTITVSANGRTLSSTVNYSSSVTTNLGKILGLTQLPLRGVASAALTMPSYVNIYVILDVSSSMGIGATASDQQLTYNATSGCVVACHYTGTTTQARSAGATLRIDVAKQALVAALNQISSAGTYAQVAIYTMSDQFTNVFSLSSNFSSAISAVNAIDISSSSNDGGTDTTYALTQLAAVLPTPGTGSTQSTAQGVVMLISDGVQDSDMKYYSGGTWADKSDPNFKAFSPCNMSSCEYDSSFGVYFQAFDPTQCTPLKNKGFTMMTLDVQYIIPSVSLQGSDASLSGVFSYIQQYLLSSIQSNMTACATSSSYAYSANTPSEITKAVATMFNTSALQARITQ